MLRELEPIETLVMNELQKKGYPRESIVFNWKLDARRYVDFVVVDTDTGMPLMMIEVKAFSERTQNAIKTMAFDNLKKYYDKEKTPIKMIAAFFNREIGEFVFVDFTEAIKENNFNKLIENYEIPTYELLTTGVRQKVISHAKEKQNKNINTLKILCWVVNCVIETEPSPSIRHCIITFNALFSMSVNIPRNSFSSIVLVKAIFIISTIQLFTNSSCSQ